LILGNNTVAGAMDTTASAFGTAVNTIVSNGAILQISSGGVGSGAIISGDETAANKAQEIIRAGGVSYDTVINQGIGYQYVNGAVAYRTVISNGSQWGNNNAKMYNTVVRGGYQIVGATVTAYDTVVSGGSQLINNGGTASRTVMLGGSALVSSGATVSDAVISGGRFSVWGGGTVNNITVVVGNGRNAVIRPEANGTIFTGNLTMDFSTAVSATGTGNYFISSVSRVAANAGLTYTIKVAQEGQYSGEYNMGGGSTNITATVVTDTGLTLGSVSGGGSVNGPYLHTQFGSYRLYTSTYQYIGIVADPVAVFQGTTIVARGTTVDTAVTVDSAREAYVRKGGTLKNLTVDAAADGKVVVYSGGVLDTATVTGATAGNIAVSNGGVANDVTLAGASAYLRLSGGTANDAVVSAGALYLLNSAAEAYRTTASAGMVDISAGRTESTTLYGAAREMVRNGATATGTVIEAGATGNQFVRAGGIAYNTVVRGGSQQLYDANAKAYDTVISGGEQQIYAGASAVRTVANTGIVRVLGNTTSTTLRGDAQELLSAATAVANGTVISGGAQKLLVGGAKAYDTVVSAGSQVLAANTEAYRTVVSASMLDNTAGRTESTTIHGAGREMVRNGATTYYTVLESDVTTGNQFVRTGGVTYYTTVRAGAQQLYDATATAYDTVVSGGEQQVFAGASAVRTVLSNGKIQNGGGLVVSAELFGAAANRLYVSNGGVASATILHDLTITDVTGGRTVSTTLYDGTQELLRSNGVASGAVVSGGAQKVLSAGAVASDTVVYAGYQQVVAGASAWNTTIVAGNNGYVNLADGAVTGGTWNFDLSQGAPTDTAMLNAWRITAGTDLVITVNTTDPWGGRYYLSSGASYFGDTTFTVKDAGGSVLANDFGDGDSVRVGDFTYKLALDGSGLYLSVSGYPVEVYTGTELTAYGTTVSGEKIVAGMSAFVNNGGTLEDVSIVRAASNKVLVSSGGTITDATVYGQGTGTDIRVYGGAVASDTFLADSTAYLRLSGGRGDNTTVAGQLLMYAGAFASNTTVIDGGVQKLMAPGASATKTVISSGGWMQVGATPAQTSGSYIAGGDASDVSVYSTGSVRVYSSATATGVKLLEEDALAYVYTGARIAFDSVASGARINLRFSEATGNEVALITGWGTVAAGAELGVKEVGGAGTFKIADSIDANITAIDYDEFDVFGGRVVAVGQNFSDVFEGLNYITTADGTLTATAFTVGSQTTAATLDGTNATTLTDGNLATTWTSATDLSIIPVVAGANTNADAWLTLDGTTVNGALYGAEGNFAHDVNLHFRDGSIKNLAAGATAGGSVENVNVMVGDINADWTEVSHGTTVTGAAYAGGFGSVAGTAGTVVNDGTFLKDFYAGALANKLATATSVGEVNMTVNGGTFSGNIYGASSVKTDTTKGNNTRHTVGDVTLIFAGGATTKRYDACIFAGGYATGDATGTVYRVESVTMDINSGDWGLAKGGRGVFGGVMASGVAAEVGDVDISISINGDNTAPTMGNVYGGGWAQKGGTSAVGNVNISISGGTVANVFGGGSHSKDGEQGTTSAGNVTITVAGGDITGAIYARGQCAGDTTQSAEVIFTGKEAFDCSVYGYSYVGGGDSDAKLSYTDYTGTFAGALGGFDGITLDGATAMTLATAADKVNNGAWNFDLADRNKALSGNVLLTWDAEAGFSGDTVKVNFKDETQAKAGWSIAAADFTDATFTLAIDSAEIGSAAYGTALSGTGTVYDGWGFALEDSVLKFKQLA
jgi:autotransporter passenger strand-loop-strand repeat protein